MSTDLELRQSLPQLRLSGDTSSPQTTESDGSSENYGCRTPTGAEHKIPAMLRCPPAPMKRRRAAVAAPCKRRLQFFESVAGDEIESFFRSSFELVANRRCIYANH